MSERKFAVIGHPIGHTMSPFIHRRLFELAGEKGEYTVMDIAPSALPEMRSTLNELSGYNITIPHKQAIIPLIDHLDPKAALYGSVNTVRNGVLHEGFTTDPDGFLKALEAASIPLAGEVCIVGCGGVARTFIYEAALAKCRITVAVRPEDVAVRNRLIEEVREKLGVDAVSGCLISDMDESEYTPDLLVNATPVGMYPRTAAVPVSDGVIRRCSHVFDAVYNPLETVLIQKAKANGAKAVGGMAMLVWQAAMAHKIWDGSVYDPDDMAQLTEDSAKEMQRLM